MYADPPVPSGEVWLEVGLMTRFAMAVGALVALLAPLCASAQSPAPGHPARAVEEQFVVVGLMLVDGAPGLAWLVEPRLTQNRAVAVRQGERVGPYQVTNILDDRVELTGPAGTVWVPVLTTGGPVVASAGPVGPTPDSGATPLGAGGRARPAPETRAPASSSPAAATPAEAPRGTARRNPLSEPMEALKRRVEAAAEQQRAAAMAQRSLLSQNPNAILAPPDPPVPTTPVAPPTGTPASGPRVSFPPQGSLMDFMKPQ
jgi:hypothetical protein